MNSISFVIRTLWSLKSSGSPFFNMWDRQFFQRSDWILGLANLLIMGRVSQIPTSDSAACKLSMSSLKTSPRDKFTPPMKIFASFQIVGNKKRRRKGSSCLRNLTGIARSPKLRQTLIRNFYISKPRTLNFWNSFWRLFGDITWRTAMRYSWFSSQGLWTG